MDKAVVSMYAVLKLVRKHNLSIKCLLSLFDQMVKPILLYGCEIWGFGNNDVLEKPVSFNIFSKNFIHLISKFCCEYKWCDKLYIMHDILDCFQQIIFAQKEIIIILMSISTGYLPNSPYII